ncbi:hypothetical protein NBRC116592_14300 [Colwellia sp. KU-HH00111]|uniref:hypothetical protein n=1 Tax=Colwellia sp. KU-HH00111 TaxID=3127652 RepID=UPI00310B5403
MIIISAKRYSYFLLEDDDGTWYLTYFTGGPCEIDICVKLIDEEIKQLKEKPEFINVLVENFKKDKSLYENRIIIPSKRPN